MENISDIYNKDIYNSTVTNNVTQILGKSYQYNDLLEQLNTQERLFTRTPENEEQERLEISEKINLLKSLIESFKRDVLQLAAQFDRIAINTDRLRRAKEYFDQGDIGEARAVLESELEQMQNEQTNLLIKQDEYETDVLPKLINNADEFLILALSTQTNYENPNWLTDTCEYFENSIKSHKSRSNIFEYALFLRKHNMFEKAVNYYNLYMKIFKIESGQSEYAMIFNNLANLHRDQNRYEEALQEYEEALEISRRLAESNPATYLPDVAMTSINFAIFYQQSLIDKAKSIKYAMDALSIVVPIIEKVPYTQKYRQVALAVLQNWGLNETEINEMVNQMNQPIAGGLQSLIEVGLV